jgi:hypothetical protein
MSTLSLIASSSSMSLMLTESSFFLSSSSKVLYRLGLCAGWVAFFFSGVLNWRPLIVFFLGRINSGSAGLLVMFCSSRIARSLATLCSSPDDRARGLVDSFQFLDFRFEFVKIL